MKVFPVSRTPPKKLPNKKVSLDVVKSIPSESSRTHTGAAALERMPKQRTKPLRSPPQVTVASQGPFVPFGEYHTRQRKDVVTIRQATDWRCPDSWIPNHRCDDFCFDSLRSTFSSFN
jgi:hypothetical protein